MAGTQRKVPAGSAEMAQFTEGFSEEVTPDSSGAGERGLSADEAEGQRGRGRQVQGRPVPMPAGVWGSGRRLSRLVGALGIHT